MADKIPLSKPVFDDQATCILPQVICLSCSGMRVLVISSDNFVLILLPSVVFVFPFIIFIFIFIFIIVSHFFIIAKVPLEINSILQVYQPLRYFGLYF